MLLGQDWADALFFIFAAVLIGAALLVVTMRDIIRCGLAMIVCFGALAGIYVIIGSPLVAAAQVIVYIGAISVLILFAIMLTQTKDAPTRLVFQTQAVPAAIASVVIAVVIALAVAATDWGELPERVAVAASAFSAVLFDEFVLPFEVVSVLLLAAVIGGVFLAEARAGRPVVSDSLDAYLVLSGMLFAIGSFGFLARRNAISMLMSIELMLNAVNLDDRRVRGVQPGARGEGIGHRADGHGRGRRRGDGRAGDRHRHLPQQANAASRRIRRDETVMRRSVRRAVGRPRAALPAARVRSRTLGCARSRARAAPCLRLVRRRARQDKG